MAPVRFETSGELGVIGVYGSGSSRFTPYGYLRNPFAVARSWEDGEGGGLRTTVERPGFGWVYPWARSPLAGASIELCCRLGDRTWTTRSDFDELGYHSAYHSCLVFSYDWSLPGMEMHARFLLAERDVLLCVVDAEPAVPAGTPADAPLSQGGRRLGSLAAHLQIRLHGWRRGGTAAAGLSGADGLLDLGEGLPPHWLILGNGVVEHGSAVVDLAGVVFSLPLSGASRRIVAALARGPRGAAAGRAALARAEQVLAERVAEDRAFWAGCPRLEGDWPAHWRNGWVYDLETTRMLLFPPGGVFQDVWPAWMVDWPRAVLAEGSLDAMRLSYAQPELAQRAMLSLFRDTPGSNVPCLFQGGEFNMVAADGSACGTSPAWCLPFYNLWLIYLRTLDRGWLAEILPHLEAYLRWWLAERTDEDGWVVYKCTWESGEDASPRLDPDREGDHVISSFTRPVELQAAMSQSAGILAFFARELGREATASTWEGVAAAFRRRTHRLWDARSGRFRDWDKRRDAFITPSAASDYWGGDPTRFSPLSLTPLLFDLASPAQRSDLRDEMEQYNAPPTTEWPSWSWAVLESATWAGFHDFAARMAAGIVERVYRANDRPIYEGPPAPMPGVSPEYWPTDLAGFKGSAGYGWGANTATVTMRQLVGFLESPSTAGCGFRLVPGLPDFGDRARERWFRVANLGYRGLRFDLTYEPDGEAVEATLDLAEAAHCHVQGDATAYASRRPSRVHRFRLARSRMAEVEVSR